jgi:hypothetical protein
MTLSIYEPQAEKWDGKVLQATAPFAAQRSESDTPSYGRVQLTARTDVDKEQNLVSLHDVSITSAEFPSDPARAASFKKTIADTGELTSVISLGRLQADLANAKTSREPGREEVKNTPPRVIFSQQPAVLVLVDGQPVMKPVEGTSVSRVVNTRALMLHDDRAFYLLVGSRWVTANAIDGVWSDLQTPDDEIDRAKDVVTREGLAASGAVDLLTNADPQAAVYASTKPAEVIATDGPPEVAPVGGTDLWYVTNTSRDVFLREEGGAKRYYVLLSGRWFEAQSMEGPWQFVAADKLPPEFAQIPKANTKANVLASVPGTTEAKEAVIANEIPQTATVPSENGPTLEVGYDGAPQFAPIESTPLMYATNTATPVIQVDPSTYFALSDGVWFVAGAPTGPWSVATSVPPVIYTIPTSSPLHYVTYVSAGSVSPGYVEEAATPGYLGTVVAPSGVVVYGTGYDYAPWVGSVWYAAPITFGFGVALGFGFGFGFHTPFVSPFFVPRFAHPVVVHPAYASHFDVYHHQGRVGVVATGPNGRAAFVGRAPYAGRAPYGGSYVGRAPYVGHAPYGGSYVGRAPYAAPRGVGGGPPAYSNVPPARLSPSMTRQVAPTVQAPRGPYPAAPAYRAPAAPVYHAPAAPVYHAAPAPAYHAAPAPAYHAAPAPAYHAAPPAYHAPAPAMHGGGHFGGMGGGMGGHHR